MSFENFPSIEFMANLAACSVLEFIRSAMASAWARSNLLFKKALLENSPGSAILIPCILRISFIRISRTTGPPCA